MPRAGSSADNATIIYPTGCREVNDDLGPDELIRRLKNLAHTFQSMGQDEGAYQEYIPLALHLADDYFLQHQSKDVQLLIACCIADVLRIYAPDAPYKDQEQVKTIFMFLIHQLEGLRDPKDPAFKRYFYLLENLAYVKSFNMCFELDDCQDIFCALFSLMFRIVNEEHSGKVKSFMLDVLCPLVTESDAVSNELLDSILINVVEPYKSQRKNAYLLAKELVVKCSDTLQPYIQSFFNQELILGKKDRNLNISKKVYDLIYELNHICPSVLLSVLPQLEFKLKSTDESERMGSVSLLARMFSEKHSTLAIHHWSLWQAFLGRFNDISVAIRTKCVQYSMHFLINHPELRKDITETLKLRRHDNEETVRYEVVMAIVATAKKDFCIVSESEDLLHFVKERMLDKKFKIRKEAMTGLAMIYRKHLFENNLSEATKKAISWIKDKILHGYYMSSIDDRLLVERLLNTSLVPYQLPADIRMKKLLYLFSTIDENANKAFIELQKHQLSVRRTVSDMVELHNRPIDEVREKELLVKINTVCKYLPDHVKAMEFLKKFSTHMDQDTSLRKTMELVVSPNVSCKECAEAMNVVLKKLGQPVMTNLYYNTVKMLLERISSVLIDRDALRLLVGNVEDCLTGPDLANELDIEVGSAGEKGLRMLYILSVVFPAHFLHPDILLQLIGFLSIKDDFVVPLVLSVLTFVGKYKPIGKHFPQISNDLIVTCRNFIQEGTPKDAKQAVRCLFVNIVPEQHQDLFGDILEKLKGNLVDTTPHYRTAIVALGHIAYNIPDKFPVFIKNTVSRKIVKDLLMKGLDESREISPEDWCEEEELAEVILCRIEGMKMMARWLLGLVTDVTSAQKTFRMLNAFVVHKGYLPEKGKLSKAEMAWLRLCAGSCMLKICEQKGVGDQFTAEQFYSLSLLMVDEVPQVRSSFAAKLHKGLGKGVPFKCLPLDFMGFYAFSGREQDKILKSAIKQYMTADINKRREYIKNLLMSGADGAVEQLPHIMPDYMLVFAVPILAHEPEFNQHGDISSLERIKQCLWFILEPLMKSENYCFGFYKALIERMKNHKDALHCEDDEANQKLWAVCDLAMNLVISKTGNFEMKEFPSEPRIPPMYFKRPKDPFNNTRVYLPLEMQSQQQKKPNAPVSLIGDKAIPRKRGRPKIETDNKNDEHTSIDLQEEEDEEEAGDSEDDNPDAKTWGNPAAQSTPLPVIPFSTNRATNQYHPRRSPRESDTDINTSSADSIRRSMRQKPVDSSQESGSIPSSSGEVASSVSSKGKTEPIASKRAKNIRVSSANKITSYFNKREESDTIEEESDDEENNTNEGDKKSRRLRKREFSNGAEEEGNKKLSRMLPPQDIAPSTRRPRATSKVKK